MKRKKKMHKYGLRIINIRYRQHTSKRHFIVRANLSNYIMFHRFWRLWFQRQLSRLVNKILHHFIAILKHMGHDVMLSGTDQVRIEWSVDNIDNIKLLIPFITFFQLFNNLKLWMCYTIFEMKYFGKYV